MRIGQLIPALIALGLGLDVASRMIPLDRLSFRAWEALAVAPGPTGPFTPDRTYVNPRSYGDLARPPRYKQLREHHLEEFRTDAWGFRKTEYPAPDGTVRWLLVGDSFGVGSGVGDGATLASQVARLSGDGVYNGSASVPLPLRDIQFTCERLGMKRGRVIYEFLERQEMPAIEAAASARHFPAELPPRRSARDRILSWRRDARVGRLNILARWGWEALVSEAGWRSIGAAPQASAEMTIVRYELTNGQSMLFYGGDIAVAGDADRRISPDYLVWLAAQLAKQDLDLVVLLVPTKYTVYRPLLGDPGAVPASGAPLRRLAESLKARGVFVVNTTTALRKEAADRLARKDYVYFIDDTHWNERGIGVAARTLMEAWTAR
jgi:alginate O-acetyltransferase complex protein AlgJ